MPITIGVDVGGSHITSAGVDMETNEIVPGTYFHGDVNNKATKESIFQDWGNVINKTLNQIAKEDTVGIGFAMPGPFQYKTGTAMFEKNDKYESLYKVSVTEEFSPYLTQQDISLRFLNDASSFALGCSLSKKWEERKKVVAITLGTGFGAAFVDNNIPIMNRYDVPEDGCLWNKSFGDGIADDYLSTRWFLSNYKKLTGNNDVKGVRDIIAFDDIYSLDLFQEFAFNLSRFMLPYLRSFDADLLQIGGSISRSKELFLPALIQNWEEELYSIPIEVVKNTEETNIIGSSFLFNEEFWANVKERLPEL